MYEILYLVLYSTYCKLARVFINRQVIYNSGDNLSSKGNARANAAFVLVQ